MSLFVKLVIRRKISFRNNSEQLSVTDCDGAVIKLAVSPKRRSDKQQRVVVYGIIHDFYKIFFARTKKGVHIKQIARRVSRQSKLGENENLDAF